MSLARPLALVVLCSGGAAPAVAQRTSAENVAPLPALGGVNAAEVVMRVFAPRAANVADLIAITGELFGSELVVLDPPGEISVPRFVPLGDRLIVRDTAPRVDQLIRFLTDLDRFEADRREQARALEAAAADEESKRRRELADTMSQEFTRLARTRYTPRFVAGERFLDAVASHRRNIERVSPEGLSDGQISNLTLAPDGSLSIVDTPERVASILATIREVDRPAPHALFQAMILLADDDQAEPVKLPRALGESLAALVPDSKFARLGTGVLRSALDSDRVCQLISTLPDDGRWKLDFTPVAFDPEGNTITLSDCAFSLAMRHRSQGPITEQSFRTHLTLACGEYVVLGAVGPEPAFLVLKADLVVPADR